MRKYGNEANIHLMSVQAIHTYKQRKVPLTGDNSPEQHFAACKIEISISRRLDSLLDLIMMHPATHLGWDRGGYQRTAPAPKSPMRDGLRLV